MSAKRPLYSTVTVTFRDRATVVLRCVDLVLDAEAGTLTVSTGSSDVVFVVDNLLMWERSR